MMRVVLKKFPDRNVPDELGVYLLHSMDALVKEAMRAVMDGSGLLLDLGNEKATQDKRMWGRNTSVLLFERDTGKLACGEDGPTCTHLLRVSLLGGGG